MARILLPVNTLVGRKLLSITQQIISLQQDTARLQAIVTQIGNGVALETSGESAVPTGTGESIVNGIAQIKTALDGLSTLVSSIDQG